MQVMYSLVFKSTHTTTYHFVGISTHIFLFLIFLAFTVSDFSGLRYVRATGNKAPYIPEIPINSPRVLTGIDNKEQPMATEEY